MKTHENVRFTIGGRTYELVPFFMGNESSDSITVLKLAQELRANLGKEDGTFILQHQNEIPKELWGKFNLIFTGWHEPYEERVARLSWFGDYLLKYWDDLDNVYYERDRLVRRLA